MPEVQKAVWTTAAAAAAMARARFITTTKKTQYLFGLLTWALAVKGDAFITCLQVVFF